MADQPKTTSNRPWILELVPLLVVILIVAHVLALVISIIPKIPFLCSLATPIHMFLCMNATGLLGIQISYRETTPEEKEALELLQD